MRNCLIAVAFQFALFFLAQPAYSAVGDDETQNPYEKGVELKMKDFEDDNFVIKTDKFVMNNCSIAEGKEYQSKRTISIKFTASIKNRTAVYERFSLIVVGLDEKKAPLWAISSDSSVEAKGVGLVHGDCSLLPRSTLKGTAFVWLRLLEWDESGDD